MRLDLFLKCSRAIKRRTTAKELIEKGSCFVNNKKAKPSTDVNVNDIIKLDMPLVVITLKVLDVSTKNSCNYELIERVVK